MRVTIIGSGYVGLVTGACLAEQGNDVLCLDLDQDKIDALNHGIIPIHEPGLAEIVSRNRAADRLSFTGDVAAGVAHADTIFIAVGTPPDEDGSADLRHVLGAAHSRSDAHGAGHPRGEACRAARGRELAHAHRAGARADVAS